MAGAFLVFLGAVAIGTAAAPKVRVFPADSIGLCALGFILLALGFSWQL